MPFVVRSTANARVTSVAHELRQRCCLIGAAPCHKKFHFAGRAGGFPDVQPLFEAAIIALFGVVNHYLGNPPLMPACFQTMPRLSNATPTPAKRWQSDAEQA